MQCEPSTSSPGPTSPLLTNFSSNHARGLGGIVAVERDVTALGRDHHLFAAQFARGHQFAQHFADRAFAALEAVVDGGVDQIDPAEQRAPDGLCVSLVSLVVGLAQISADPDRGNAQPPEHRAEISRQCGVAAGVGKRPLGRGAVLQHGESPRRAAGSGLGRIYVEWADVRFEQQLNNVSIWVAEIE